MTSWSYWPDLTVHLGEYAALTGRLAGELGQALGYLQGRRHRGAHHRHAGRDAGAGGHDGEDQGGEWEDSASGDDRRQLRRPPSGACAPPAALVQLHQHVERAVLVAFGIPAPLLPSSMADGVAKRESMRALRVQTLEPLRLLIAEELAATDPNMRSGLLAPEPLPPGQVLVCTGPGSRSSCRTICLGPAPWWIKHIQPSAPIARRRSIVVSPAAVRPSTSSAASRTIACSGSGR